MKVIMVEPLKPAYVAEIGTDLESMQKAVGGDIETVYPYTDPLVLVCDEEGKYDGKEKNRALVSDSGEIYDVVFGTFFIAGIGDEEFTSVPDNLTEKYLEKYKNPHAFIKSDTGKYIVVELPVEICAKLIQQIKRKIYTADLSELPPLRVNCWIMKLVACPITNYLNIVQR